MRKLPRVYRTLTSVGFMLGIILGFTFGAAFAIARRGWTDYRKVKASVPGMRKTAWGLIRIATTKGGIVTLLIVAAIAWAALGALSRKVCRAKTQISKRLIGLC